MATQDKKRRIDAQWQAQSVGWDSNHHSGEREMLYDILEDDENIKQLMAAQYLYTSDGLSGVLVATNRRILFFDRGLISQHSFHWQYVTIESVEFERKQGLFSSNRFEIAISNPRYRHNDPDIKYEFRHVSESEALPFCRWVRTHLASPAVAEARRKATRVDIQWRQGGWRYWQEYAGEREVLYATLEDDENIENVMGCTYRPYAASSLRRGIAVATDRRVLLTSTGSSILPREKDVVKMPYRSISIVTYNRESFNPFDATMEIICVDNTRYIMTVSHARGSKFADCVQAHLDSGGLSQSDADEIGKLASLLKQGVLTWEEFDAKKKQLLGISSVDGHRPEGERTLVPPY